MIGTDGENYPKFEKRTYAEVTLSKIETQKNGGPESWVRCGYVSRVLCKCWEVHPRGRLRWWKASARRWMQPLTRTRRLLRTYGGTETISNTVGSPVLL